MLFISILIGCASLLYATAGQVGGTAFLAVMTFASFPTAEMRPTALFLNVIAASYATWQLHRRGAIDWCLLRQVVPASLLTAFIGGLIVLEGRIYFTLVGVLLIGSACLMMFKRGADSSKATPVRPLQAIFIGAITGLLSGLSGVGGGVFLAPQLVAFGWTSPKHAAELSPPFILCNSIIGLIGALASGQNLAHGATVYALWALAGAALGTAIGARWMSEQATRYALSSIIIFAGIRLLLR